jgi:hypothetical protein
MAGRYNRLADGAKQSPQAPLRISCTLGSTANEILNVFTTYMNLHLVLSLENGPFLFLLARSVRNKRIMHMPCRLVCIANGE